MTTRIVRTGNTLTVEIPEELADQAELSVDEPLEWIPDGKGGITLAKSSQATPRKRANLEAILEGIPEGTHLGEYDWGSPRGAETCETLLS